MTQVNGIAKQLVQSQTDTIGPQVIYNSPLTGGGTIISAVTVSNSTLKDESFAVFIGPAGVVPDAAIIPMRTIKAGRTDPAPEIIGQVMPPGTALWVENISNSLLFTISGRELNR